MKLLYTKLPLLLLAFCLLVNCPVEAQTETELKDISINGGVQDGKARLVIEGVLDGSRSREKLIFSTSIFHVIKVARDRATHQFTITADILQGDPKELELAISGEGEIRKVTGESLQDWSIRREADGKRTLLLRPKKGEQAIRQLIVQVIAEREVKDWEQPIASMALTPPTAALSSGFVKVEYPDELHVEAVGPGGLFPVEPQHLPEAIRGVQQPGAPVALAYQFHGSTYSLPLKISAGDPEMRRVVLHDFRLTGQLKSDRAAFTLTATARVANPKGGTLDILAGGVALSELASHPDWRMTAEAGRFRLVFDKPGEYPLNLKFHAAVQQNEGWSRVNFKVAPSTLQPVVLESLPADTQLVFAGAARPERSGETFTSYLPPDGSVQLSWRMGKEEGEGKLFYAAEMLSQISVSPGLMRQVALFEGKVMQGETTRITMLLKGAGEVTRVVGEQVLAWKVEPGANPNERRLLIEFNQPQKGQFSLHVHTQTPIGAFPQTLDALRIQPADATRFAGYLRVVNEGAVRLEILESTGLSQVSPEQFPETDATKSALSVSGSQRFVYRFSSADTKLRIQAEQILPELSVSKVISYHYGENEQTIDAEIEVDVREAPLRELLLRVPRGYAVSRLGAEGMSDYFLTDASDANVSELRLVYGQPTGGRQIIQLRLERNQPLGNPDWDLPRVEVVGAKSVRGHIAASADSGFRLAPTRTQGLTDIATAFFPRKLPNIHAAFRISEPAWSAALRIERLPQSVQADAFHLFSIGEGVAYGSSLVNYVISGAPVAAFRVELAEEYFNVEFSGKDIRSWQKAENGYLVQLHTPVSGAYTLLATYERPFKEQGETLTFTGARPLDAQAEQGYTLVISAYQFQVQPAQVSEGLLLLETGEVPPEYRLLFDAPILAAYRYSARPFDLKLALSPLAQGDSLNQVVDRAELITRISKEGQVLTEAQYFVKSRGAGSFRVTLPAGTELWSATVNGATVVPVKDGDTTLVPLPQQADPDNLLNIVLKLADRSKDARRLKVSTPSVAAPGMLANWSVTPDTAQKVVYREGALVPVDGTGDVSGFANLVNAFSGRTGAQALVLLIAAVALVLVAVLAWWSTVSATAYRWSLRFWFGGGVGIAAFIMALAALLLLADLVHGEFDSVNESLKFVAPVQQAGSALWVDVANVPEEPSVFTWIGYGWPIILAIAVWAYGWLVGSVTCRVLGWGLLGWVVLRFPNSGVVFVAMVAVFVTLWVAVPAIRALWWLPRRPRPAAPTPSGPTPTPAAVAVVMIAAMVSVGGVQAQEAEQKPAPPPEVRGERPVAQSVIQKIRVEEEHAFAEATIEWRAEKGQRLPILFSPGVVTNVEHPAELKLVKSGTGKQQATEVLSSADGLFAIRIQYQVPVTRRGEDSGFTLPTQFGLVNRASLTLMNHDVDIVSSGAVAIDRKSEGKDTVAELVLGPQSNVWIGWKPRSRDVSSEASVYYAEFAQLYVPTAGVIDGVHRVAIRPAQGELKELTFSVPKGATITDVQDPAVAMSTPEAPIPSIVSQWRFDPDAGKLRVTLASAQSRPFALVVRSQIATGPLPVEQSLGLISLDGAAGQIGALAVATGNEVQLDSATAEALSPMNLEDFPAGVAGVLQAEVPGITVRRAFRYAELKASVTLKASAVQPDIRVESQDTLSLGEDRTLLAIDADVEITRAGIFRLSFVLPAGMDVESIDGDALSHWTELKTEAERVITLHLKNRTEGGQKFAISLVGPGLKSGDDWVAPQVVFREASKQRGTYLVVPEQGMRLQVATREGLTQLDPQKANIRQKGVLAFRILQSPWKLALDIEQVDAWVQVTSLQHTTIEEAQAKVAMNLQYQIENTGLKGLRVELPAAAENVRITGDQVADHVPSEGAAVEGMKIWDVKLHRRVIGNYVLNIAYQLPLPGQAPEVTLRGVRALDVDTQRGYVTLQPKGRLQLRVETLPPALQPVEWQSIPRVLQQGIGDAVASHAYRLVEPTFQLAVRIDRREAAKLLPARVERVNFTTVVADSGARLTKAELSITPGDKRLLHLTLPRDAQFWFAFVDQKGVWPWREGEQILIPLEQGSQTGKPVRVAFFYSNEARAAKERKFDLAMEAPKFDLPLENITWDVYLNDRWRIEDWGGTLQMEREMVVSYLASADIGTYLSREASEQQEKTKVAEQMLAFGNSALQMGDPQQARRAFESAYGLSQHDDAFNEDARVQLHNLKLQQALVGLNVRRSNIVGEGEQVAGKLREDSPNRAANYTQQDAKQIIDRNSPDESAALFRLAERLIQQQDAAVTKPAVINASVPEQGRKVTFSRSVAVDPWADLRIELEGKATSAASWSRRLMIFLATVLVFGVLAFAGRSFRRRVAASPAAA